MRWTDPALKTALCSLLLFILGGCATTAEKPGATVPGIEIDGVEIVNELGYQVTDVMILVPRTGAFVGCGTVLGGTSCSTSFPGRAYQQNAVQVTWKELGQPYTTGDFNISLPADLQSSHQFWIKVVIFAPGQAGAKLEKNRK